MSGVPGDATTRRLRIAVLAWRDLRHPEAGGSEVYVHEVTSRWARDGHDVTLVTARPGALSRDEVLDGVRHVRRGGRLGVYPLGLAWLVRHGAEVDVAVDVINGLPFGIPLARPRVSVALVHHVHRRQWQLIYPDLRGRAGWFVESRVVPWLYRRVPFVAVSGATRDDLGCLGIDPASVHVVRNGLSARPRAGVPTSSTPRVVVLTRLVPHKQVEHVLEATRRLRDRHPGLRVDVVGDGWWRGPLEARAAELGVEDLVTFHGHVDDDRRDSLLATAWVMVLPSVTEGWGIAVTEAAVQGTPTVGYRSSGGLTESVLDGRTGWLADDLDGLVARVDDVLTGRVDLDGVSRQARERALTLDWDTTARSFLDVLRAAGAGVARGRDLSGRRRR
ncbi:glycosyltransferase family 4 protein [Oryzobacter telluris]|uniref:glycosyltransferase family 4 protein n=1 Tax=Oryzobacter telluris TaxID=3149179 RepID=UPI00370D0B4D